MKREVRSWILNKENKLVEEKIEMESSNSVVVQMILSSVCGTDLHILDRHDSLKRPLSLGHEFIGKVISIPDSSYDYQIGDKLIIAPGVVCHDCVYCKKFHNDNWCTNRKSHGIYGLGSNSPILGGFSTEVALIDGIRAYKIPEGMSDDRAVLSEPLTVAIRAVDRATNSFRGVRDKTITVVGLGPIGTMTAMVAKLYGYSVIGFDVSQYRINYVKNIFGIEAYHADYMKKGMSSIPDEGTDIAIECTGIPVTVGNIINIIRRGGRIVVAGHFYPNGKVDIDPYDICKNDIEIVGTVLGDETAYRTAINILSENVFPWEKVISHKYEFEKTPDAFQKAKERNCMKVTVKSYV